MDIVFLHGNYPAQFRNLAALMAQDSTNRVVFLTAREDAQNDKLPGIKIKEYKCHRRPSAQTHHYLQATEDAVLEGQAVLREVASLMDGGFRPESPVH